MAFAHNPVYCISSFAHIRHLVGITRIIAHYTYPLRPPPLADQHLQYLDKGPMDGHDHLLNGLFSSTQDPLTIGPDLWQIYFLE